MAGRERGWQRDLLRRQDRRRAGDRDRHPADDVRRARPRLRPGHGGHGTHRPDRGPGRLGRLGRDRARRHGRTPDRGGGPAGAAGDGVGAVRRAGGGASRERRRDLAGGRSLADGHLRGAHRRAALRRRPDRRQHQPDRRGREHQAGAGPEAGRPVGPALRHPRQGGRVVRVGRRRQPPRNGPRPERAPTLRGRDADRRRRVLGARAARLPPGGARGQLRRGRVRARRAGDRGRGKPVRHLGKARHGAVPGVGRPLRLPAERGAGAEPGRTLGAGGRGRSRRGAGGRGDRRRGRLRRPLPGAHRDRTRPRAGRSLGRPDDDLHERHEAVQPPDRHRRVPGHAAGTGAGDLDGGPAALRAHRGGRRGLRGRLPGEGAGAPRAGAVDAARGDGVGHQGSRLRHRPPRADSMRTATWSRWTIGAGSPTTRTSATTRPGRCSSRN